MAGSTGLRSPYVARVTSAKVHGRTIRTVRFGDSVIMVTSLGLWVGFRGVAGFRRRGLGRYSFDRGGLDEPADPLGEAGAVFGEIRLPGDSTAEAVIGGDHEARDSPLEIVLRRVSVEVLE